MVWFCRLFQHLPYSAEAMRVVDKRCSQLLPADLFHPFLSCTSLSVPLWASLHTWTKGQEFIEQLHTIKALGTTMVGWDASPGLGMFATHTRGWHAIKASQCMPYKGVALHGNRVKSPTQQAKQDRLLKVTAHVLPGITRASHTDCTQQW